MNGGPLSANPYLTYEPHNSFDRNGCLLPESYEAKDQVGTCLLLMIFLKLIYFRDIDVGRDKIKIKRLKNLSIVMVVFLALFFLINDN